MWTFERFFHLRELAQPWMVSHMQLPTPLVLPGGAVRVFFASRDSRQYSHIGFVDLGRGVDGRLEVLSVASEPVLVPGPIGHFDEHGVFPSCALRRDGSVLLYYIGWNKGCEAPLFYASIGVAESHDGSHFEKLSPSPVLARSPVDPCLVTSPWVMQDGERLTMTYVSGIGWYRDAQGRLQSRYHIKSARGVSPLEWIRQGDVAIDLGEDETNVARSTVLCRGEAQYAMWFSYVRKSVGAYRIGYAESRDGLLWHRKDSASGIQALPPGADQMMCYPAVFELGQELYMLYNGNGFGSEGFGLLRWRA